MAQKKTDVATTPVEVWLLAFTAIIETLTDASRALDRLGECPGALTESDVTALLAFRSKLGLTGPCDRPEGPASKLASPATALAVQLQRLAERSLAAMERALYTQAVNGCGALIATSPIKNAIRIWGSEQAGYFAIAPLSAIPAAHPIHHLIDPADLLFGKHLVLGKARVSHYRNARVPEAWYSTAEVVQWTRTIGTADRERRQDEQDYLERRRREASTVPTERDELRDLKRRLDKLEGKAPEEPPLDPATEAIKRHNESFLQQMRAQDDEVDRYRPQS